MNQYQGIETIINRYNKITVDRTNRALAAMRPEARHLFEIIPVLLQYNHPLLPGYIPGNTPHGISNFHLSNYQQDYLDRISNVGNCNIESYIENPAILSLYCMGSTSSVGQTLSSDLDIWVCYSHFMEPENISKLEQKCGVISNVAQNQNFEVNFFLVPDDKFRSDNTSSIDSENCGSALHLLLLEEFYRTSLWLAGKKLVWYLISDEFDIDAKTYDSYVSKLFEDGVIKGSEWFDLGPVNNIPVQEFFGSAMWLLYKGVDSPFKATIKILLMEAYAVEYPKIRFVANQIRKKMQESDRYDISMDSYYSVYERIIAYLKKINSDERLIMVQACFLMKVMNELNFNDSSVYMQWRINFVNEFIRKNGIPKQAVNNLLEHKNWKIGKVVDVYRKVVNVMIESNSRLRNFSNKVQKLGSPIDITDLQILSQKLSSAFEFKKGKIQKVNLNIAPSVNEKMITLIYVAENRLNRNGWYLYTSSIYPTSIISKKCVYFNRNIVDVLLWAIINGVLTKKTRIFLSNNAPNHIVSKIDQLVIALLDMSLSFHDIYISNKDLIGPMYFKKIHLFLNLSADASSDKDKIEIDLENIDVLSFGLDNRSLVNSIDLVFANSWGEIFVNHYEGNDEIINALFDIANVHKPGADIDQIPEVSVYSYSSYLTGVIKQQVKDLMNDLLKVSHGVGEENKSIVFMLGDKAYSAIRNAKNVTITLLKNSLNYIESIKSVETNMFEERAKSPELEKIYQYSCKGVLQFFFEEIDEGFKVFVLNESNQLKSYVSKQQNLSELVDAINKTYQDRFTSDDNTSISNFSSHSVHFSLPQFYQVKNSDGQFRVVIYSAR